MAANFGRLHVIQTARLCLVIHECIPIPLLLFFLILDSYPNLMPPKVFLYLCGMAHFIPVSVSVKLYHTCLL